MKARPLVVPFSKCYTHHMPNFTFIHAADLHLGAPFKGLDAAASGAFPAVSGKGNLLTEAGFAALERLENACRETGADFLILAGDVYDDRDGVLRARFALRDMFVRLKEADVRVFIAHGNHDPLRQGPAPVAWPDNVTVFGKDVSCECVLRDGAPLALVQGISHARPGESENLALRFRRYEPGTVGAADPMFARLPRDVPRDMFQIAVLHCAVGGAGEEHAPYAPCSLSDLTGAGFDYWALGHVHQGKILCENPPVVYPGSFLGLHINESGPRGCCVVRVDGGVPAVERLPLAPVIWKTVRVPVGEMPEPPGGPPVPDGPDNREAPYTLDALEERIAAFLDEAAKEADAALLCRVVLEGATELDAVLRRPGSAAALLERARRETASGADGTRVWVKDVIVSTSPVRDDALLAARDDLVGEVVRMAAALNADPARAADMAEKALAPLRGHVKLKKALAAGAADAASGAALLAGSPAAPLTEEAKALLCSLLEGGE